MKWSQKRFNQKYSTIESTEEYCVLEGCVPCIVIHIKLFCTNGSAQLVLFFILFRVAHAEAMKVLNSKTQCHTKNKASWKIGETCMSALSETLSFQSNSPWFNVSELKLSTPKGNQCNRFLGSLLLLSLL